MSGGVGERVGVGVDIGPVVTHLRELLSDRSGIERSWRGTSLQKGRHS